MSLKRGWAFLILWVLSQAALVQADDSAPPIPKVDSALIDQYRTRLLADPNMQNRVQGMMRDPYASGSDALIDKGYEKVLGRDATPMEKDYVRHQLQNQDPNTPLSDLTPEMLTAPPPSADPLASDPLASDPSNPSSDDIWSY